jgi:hypothetical protein
VGAGYYPSQSHARLDMLLCRLAHTITPQQSQIILMGIQGCKMDFISCNSLSRGRASSHDRYEPAPSRMLDKSAASPGLSHHSMTMTMGMRTLTLLLDIFIIHPAFTNQAAQRPGAAIAREGGDGCTKLRGHILGGQICNPAAIETLALVKACHRCRLSKGDQEKYIDQI